jgi:hypothetical protein
MFTVIYEPLNAAACARMDGYDVPQPSRAVQALSFWLGAQADDGRKGPFSIRTGKPKVPEASGPTTTPFNLVVGGVYRCRDGWLVHIHRRRIATMGQVSYFGRRINPITGEASPEGYWTPGGLFGRALHGDAHDYTIAAPYTQPQEG